MKLLYLTTVLAPLWIQQVQSIAPAASAINYQNVNFGGNVGVQQLAARAGNQTVSEDELLEARDLGTRSTDQITNFMTQCQYKIILKITSFFETSNLNLGFNVCSTTNDAQGISAGFIQFTSCSGSLETVCREYASLKQNSFCGNYLTYLDQAVGLSSCGGNWGQYTPAGLATFCTDWSNSASDPLFQQAQLNIQFSSYFEPITPLFGQYGIKNPLTMGQLYDISIQLGPSTASTLAAAASKSAGGSPASNRAVSESRWLAALLMQRSKMLNAMGGAYANTQYRVKAYQSMSSNPKFKNDQATFLSYWKDGSGTWQNVPVTANCS
ncbi:hypothetical protein HDU98_007523 [Podochytrium sp. JEL0797]|nr:hypothetical protein HDU98_007523 [Podochytrium sp. JEL0797]